MDAMGVLEADTTQNVAQEQTHFKSTVAVVY